MEAIETDLFICNPEKFSIIFRWHSWPRHGHLSLNIEQVRPTSFSRSLRGLKVVLGWAAHDPMGPTIWDESAEIEAVEALSPFLFFSSFYAGLSIPSVTVPASCALTESRNYSLIGIKKRRYHPTG